jgi:hypothetical protein
MNYRLLLLLIILIPCKIVGFYTGVINKFKATCEGIGLYKAHGLISVYKTYDIDFVTDSHVITFHYRFCNTQMKNYFLNYQEQYSAFHNFSFGCSFFSGALFGVMASYLQRRFPRKVTHSKAVVGLAGSILAFTGFESYKIGDRFFCYNYYTLDKHLCNDFSFYAGKILISSAAAACSYLVAQIVIDEMDEYNEAFIAIR